MESEKKIWQCVESDPQIFNFLAQKLGFHTYLFAFSDLYSLEEELANFFQAPVLGFILVSPDIQTKPNFEVSTQALANAFFMKQFSSNACGTIALFHVLGNLIFNRELPKDLPIFSDDSKFKEFFQKTQFMNPTERGEHFENSSDLNEIHKSAVDMNKSKESHEKVDYHFSAFVNYEGLIVEFDGCKDSPIAWTPINSSFQADCLKVIKEIVELSKFEKFTVLVLSPS